MNRNPEILFTLFIGLILLALFINYTFFSDHSTVVYTISECHSENGIEVCRKWTERRPA